MDKNFAHKRLLQAIEYLKDNGKARNHEEISILSGIVRTNVTAMINGNHSRITEGNFKKFARAYSDYINEHWLLTGEGEMSVPKDNEKPHIPVDVAAGFTGLSMTANATECDYVTLDDLYGKQRDCTVRIKGDSMIPIVYDGDYVMCEKIKDKTQINENDMYVLDTKDGAVIKKVKQNKDGVTVVSLNPFYEPYEILNEDILAIYKVGGIIRKF